MDIYRLLHPVTAEYTFFSNSSETYTKREHILDHKTYFNKFKKIKIIHTVSVSDYNEIKLEITNKSSWKAPKYLESNTLLNNIWVKKKEKKSQEKFKNNSN